jgi:hypothetical protein
VHLRTLALSLSTPTSGTHTTPSTPPWCGRRFLLAASGPLRRRRWPDLLHLLMLYESLSSIWFPWPQLLAHDPGNPSGHRRVYRRLLLRPSPVSSSDAAPRRGFTTDLPTISRCLGAASFPARVPHGNPSLRMARSPAYCHAPLRLPLVFCISSTPPWAPVPQSLQVPALFRCVRLFWFMRWWCWCWGAARDAYVDGELVAWRLLRSRRRLDGAVGATPASMAATTLLLHCELFLFSFCAHSYCYLVTTSLWLY